MKINNLPRYYISVCPLTKESDVDGFGSGGSPNFSARAMVYSGGKYQEVAEPQSSCS